MYDGDAGEVPATVRAVHMPRDLGLGHPGIVLQRHRNERHSRFAAAADADKGYNRTNVVAPARQCSVLARGIKGVVLQADSGGHDGHFLPFRAQAEASGRANVKLRHDGPPYGLTRSEWVRNATQC
jgi:hypothetical protein